MNESPPARGFTPDRAASGDNAEGLGKIGVLLDQSRHAGRAPTTGRSAATSREFLSDRRVIEDEPGTQWWVHPPNFARADRSGPVAQRHKNTGRSGTRISNKYSASHHHPGARREGGVGAPARAEIAVDWAMRYGYSVDCFEDRGP